MDRLVGVRGETGGREVEIKPGFLHCASRRARSEANAKKRRRLRSEWRVHVDL